MNLSTALNFIIFSGGIFSLILALGQFSIKNKLKDNLLFAALLFSIGFALVSTGFTYVAHSDTIYGLVYYLKVVFYFFVGPLTYFYFQNLIQFDSKLINLTVIPFIPVFLVALVNALFISYGLYNGLPIAPGVLTESNIVQLILFVSAIGVAGHSAIYLSLVLISLIDFRIQLSEESKKNVNIALIITVSGYLINFAWIVDKLIAIDIEIYIHCSLTLLIVFLYIIGNRHPNFLYIMKLESIRSGYAKSHINGLYVPGVINRLIYLMENDKIFRNEDLTLKSLSELCAVSPHQLSQILNEKLNKSFYTLINEYRIKEAQKIIKNDPKRTILSIAMDVGFNSQSAFYSACSKILKVSPGTLRKNTILK